MDLLKHKNWWIWLILAIFGNGSSPLLLAALLNLYKKYAWYANWRNWLIGVLCLFFPAVIMMYIFMIQMTCLVAAKLEVKGHEYYLSPYVWVIMLIIPIIGWIAMAIMYLYLNISILVALYNGKGEQYIK